MGERAADLQQVVALARREREPQQSTLAFDRWIEDRLEARGIDWLSVVGNKTEKQGWPYLQLPVGFFTAASDAKPNGNLLIYKTALTSRPGVGFVDITERHLLPWVGDTRREVPLAAGFEADIDNSKIVVFRSVVGEIWAADGAPEPGSARADIAGQAVAAITPAARWLLEVAELSRVSCTTEEPSATRVADLPDRERPAVAPLGLPSSTAEALLARIVAGWNVVTRRSAKGNLLLDSHDGTGKAALALYADASGRTRLQLDRPCCSATIAPAACEPLGSVPSGVASTTVPSPTVTSILPSPTRPPSLTPWTSCTSGQHARADCSRSAGPVVFSSGTNRRTRTGGRPRRSSSRPGEPSSADLDQVVASQLAGQHALAHAPLGMQTHPDWVSESFRVISSRVASSRRPTCGGLINEYRTGA